MRKPSSLIFSISLMLLCELSVAQTDSLGSSKKSVSIGINYGLSPMNKLFIMMDKGDVSSGYWVNSKVKNWLDLTANVSIKHLDICFGITKVYSEFSGNPFQVFFSDGGQYHKYLIYQDVKYNVLYGNIGAGYNFKCGKRSFMDLTLLLSIPASYNISINNIYSKTGQTNDTTLYSASKNCFNSDKNFGHFPRGVINASYSYRIWRNLFANFSLRFMYCLTYKTNYPDDDKQGTLFNHSNSYSFFAYDIYKQVILTPSIGIKLKFK